jgi:hypothetical protein
LILRHNALGCAVDPAVRQHAGADIIHNTGFKFVLALIALFAGVLLFPRGAGVIIIRRAVPAAPTLPYHRRAALAAKQFPVQQVFHLRLCMAGGLGIRLEPVAHALF